MPVYRICEGTDDESFDFVDLVHEKTFTEEEFNKMYEDAKITSRLLPGRGYLNARDVALVMCKEHGFAEQEILYVKNIDME